MRGAIQFCNDLHPNEVEFDETSSSEASPARRTSPPSNDRALPASDIAVIPGYNDAQVPLSSELWSIEAFQIAPPSGAIVYAFPAPQTGHVWVGVVAPQMGFYPPTDNTYMAENRHGTGGNEGTPDTALTGSRAILPILPPPEKGCNGHELCTITTTILFQSAVFVFCVIAAVCHADLSNPITVSSPACHSFYWEKGKAGVTVSGIYIAVVVIVAFVYLLESIYNPFRQYLSNLRNRVEGYTYLAHLSSACPHLKWSIQNYHYETRTRTVTDSKGNTTIETYTVRVNTHYACGSFVYDAWRNLGPPPLLSDVKALRVRQQKDYAFADKRTSDLYFSDFQNFVTRNITDACWETSRWLEIDGWEDYWMCLRDDGSGENSCQGRFYSSAMYWLFTLLTLSGWYRIGVAMTSFAMDYTFLKEVKRV